MIAFFLKTFLALLIWGGVWTLRKWWLTYNSKKNHSIVKLLKLRAMDEVEDYMPIAFDRSTQGIPYMLSKDGTSIICEFALETLIAKNRTDTTEYETLTMVDAISLPCEAKDFVDKLQTDEFVNEPGFEYSVELKTEFNYTISITVYVDIDYSNKPKLQLEAYVDLLRSEASRLRTLYKSHISSSEIQP